MVSCTIYGDGQQRRCFTDVRDILPCFALCLDQPDVAGETINIGPDEEFTTILELAELIADVLNFSGLDPVFVDPRPQEVKHAACSADKSRRLLSYETKYRLRNSIADMAAWIAKRGIRKFRYHLDLEILNEKTPKTWSQKMFC